MMTTAECPEARESRTYVDFEDVPAALDGVCQLYEQNLKVSHPTLKSISYDVSDLFGFICARPRVATSGCGRKAKRTL